MGGRKNGLDGGEWYGRKEKKGLDGGIWKGKEGLDGGEKYRRKEKRAGGRRMVWEEAKKD
jgi:hypothetical protein